jgi:hypothetical protein
MRKYKIFDLYKYTESDNPEHIPEYWRGDKTPTLEQYLNLLENLGWRLVQVVADECFHQIITTEE